MIVTYYITACYGFARIGEGVLQNVTEARTRYES